MRRLGSISCCFMTALCACSSPRSQPGDPPAVASCLANGDSPECLPNGQTGSLGMCLDEYQYGVGLACPATATKLEPHGDTGLGFDAQALIELVSGTPRDLFTLASPILLK